jgi:hypothetical protein
VLVEIASGALLVRGDDELVALTLKKLAQAELVLDGPEQARLLARRLAALVKYCEHLHVVACGGGESAREGC